MSRKRKHKPDGLGLKVLYHPPSESDAVVDIVFVHGLRGNRTRTWTMGGTFWPRDLLADDIPQARIMTWGYDADVMKFFGLGPTGRGNIRDHARGLNQDLAAKRLKEHQVQRPIIFVAHSLGGLVVKRALLLSKDTPKHLDRGIIAIRESTKGILFAGTPHQGSDKAKWLGTATKLLSFLQRDRSTVLISALERGSDVLEDLQEDFQTILGRFAIYTFIEELPYPRIGKIVEKDSARVGWNETIVPIHANHSKMVKFDSADDPNYERFRYCIEVIIRDKIEADVTESPDIRRSLRRGCTFGTHPETLIEEDSSPSCENRSQEVKSFSRQDSGKLNRRDSSARSSFAAPSESSDSEESDSELAEAVEKSLSPQKKAAIARKKGKHYMEEKNRDNPKLMKANKHFLKALDILMEMPDPDPAGMVRTLHLLMSVRMEMSYDGGLSSEERLSHLDKARAYNQDALEYALRSPLPEYKAIVRLYQAVLSARQVEVSLEKMSASEAHDEKEEALYDLSRSLRKLPKSSSSYIIKHYAWVEDWRVRFLKTFETVVAVET